MIKCPKCHHKFSITKKQAAGELSRGKRQTTEKMRKRNSLAAKARWVAYRKAKKAKDSHGK